MSHTKIKKNHKIVKRIAQDELIYNADFIAQNIPVACKIMRTLVKKLEDGEDQEDFIFQLKYIIYSVEENINIFDRSLAGYRT